MTPVRPSEVTDYIRCPRLWQYKHVEGWEPPASAWTPERLMGSAIHAGLAEHWRHLGDSAPHDAAQREFSVLWPPNAPPEFSREGLEVQCVKVLDKVLAWVKVNMSDAEPVMVEQPLGADGHTIPDLVTREEDQLVVTDWKTSWDTPADRVRYKLEGIERDHQFLHYCWAVGEHLGEPVRLFRKVVIVGGPKIMVKDTTFAPTPEAIEYWLTGARQMWKDMAQMRTGERVAWQNPNGCRMYGAKYPCPYYDGCWTAHGNPVKMAQFLTRRAS